MAYPTINFQPTSTIMGLQPISLSSATQAHPIGTLVRAQDVTFGEGEFRYLKGAASTAAGDVVCFDSHTGATVRAQAGGLGSSGPLAIAMSACGAGEFGWYQLSGSGPVNAAPTVANSQAYLSATAGQIDDTGSAAVSDLLIKAATNGGFATAQLARPSVNPADTGTNTGDVTVGAVGTTPSNAGASLSGQVLTLQPADATHPGVIANAPQTLPGTKTFAGAVILDASLTRKHTPVADSAYTAGQEQVLAVACTRTVAIGGLVRVGTTVTVTISANHGLHVGDVLTLAPGEAQFAAGDYTIATAPTPTTFTYTDGVGTESASTAQQTFNCNHVVALPTASGNAGLEYLVKKVDATASTVTVDPAGSEKIEGSSTLVLKAQWDYVHAISDGAQWMLFDKVVTP